MASPPSATEPACLEVGQHWPQTVSGQQPAQVRTSSAALRAWGDPPIIARCGVEPPGPTTQDCIAVDGVDWIVDPLSDGTRFTSYGRAPALEVLVPSRYAPEPLVLPAFSAAASALPDTGHHCS